MTDEMKIEGAKKLEEITTDEDTVKSCRNSLARAWEHYFLNKRVYELAGKPDEFDAMSNNEQMKFSKLFADMNLEKLAMYLMMSSINHGSPDDTIEMFESMQKEMEE